MKDYYLGVNTLLKQGLVLGLVFSGEAAGLIAEKQAAIAQQEQIMLPMTFVATSETSPTTVILGYESRFSRIVGSGALILNAQNEVTAYYFTVTRLEASATYAYHFHNAMNGATPTSCEGDKALFENEADGEVLVDLSAIAPLKSTEGGIGFMGSTSHPIQLLTPVPLSEIGYINIHPAPGGQIGPGVVCANIRLNPGGFDR